MRELILFTDFAMEILDFANNNPIEKNISVEDEPSISARCTSSYRKSATSIYNEYKHVYQMTTQKGNYSEEECSRFRENTHFLNIFRG